MQTSGENISFDSSMSVLETIPRMSEIASMLGNESRLLLLQLIAEGEKSVETLSEHSGLPVASTSQQLQLLKKSRMVATRRAGKRILYRLEPGPIRELLEALEKFAVFKEVQETKRIRNEAPENHSGISNLELQAKMKKGGILVVDVRSSEEYKKGHIPNAISVPLQELGAHKFPKNKEVIVYCRGPLCILSVNALAVLHAREITASRLATGYSGWASENL